MTLSCKDVSGAKQRNCSFSGSITKKVRLDFLLHLPEGYDPEGDKKWPLIVFLHGMGERGSDLSLVKKHGIPKVVEEKPDFPFITVSPQCPGDSYWTNEVESLKALIDEIIANYAVDGKRVYLTGLSMGGFGTWHLATAYPDMFAAAAPICGGGDSGRGFPEKVAAMRDVPVWAFHGAQDDVVPLESSEKMVNALKAAGGDVRLTVYPEAKHDSWSVTYDDPELYQWFLAHRCRE